MCAALLTRWLSFACLFVLQDHERRVLRLLCVAIVLPARLRCSALTQRCVRAVTVAVRTGGPGAGGLSLLLLERGMPGLATKQMKVRVPAAAALPRLRADASRLPCQCMGVWPSGTTYITMEDVKVPVENLIGPENGGFKCIM